ncbi:hypothetical protein BJ508DRAFT_317650 [Ascobolus immersus RN42]|uniref:Rhodopsin domain-containing protein n=1 Tax=Ascobolus immersus RN42 TaxID=1160509 RepID=A0A3N4IH46_ASCIM|nr:hypothetical protein BJ508DRAFT_317650 [Ascobolus immersus RN42]
MANNPTISLPTDPAAVPQEVIPSRDVQYYGVTFSLLPIAIIFVALRLYCRGKVLGRIGSDDWLMVVALACTIALAIMNCFHVKHGTGTSQIYFDMKDWIPTLKLWYWYQLQYLLSLAMVKFSILAFYLRLSKEKTFRYSVYAVMAVVGVYTVIMLFVNIFECPGRVADAWGPNFPAGCNDLVIVYYWQASFNILTDIIILVLPFPTLRRLQVNQAKKWALFGIFGVGSIAVIASIVRINALYIYQHSKDVPYDAIYLLLWSQIELNVAIISASAPALKPLFRSVFGASVFGKSNQGKSMYGNNGDGTGMGNNSIALKSKNGKNGTQLASVSGDSIMNESEEAINVISQNDLEDGIRKTTNINVSVDERMGNEKYSSPY